MKGTREQAVVYALASATLMFEVARRCAMNKVVGCECGTENWDIPPHPHMVDEPLDTNGKAPIQYHWGGCADNIQVGREYTKAFLGVPSDAPPTPRRIPVEYRSNPLFSVPVERLPMPLRLQPRKATNFKNVMRTVNLHNYKVGIKIIEDTQKVRCKCQGVSGSCAQKICFRQLLRADSAQLQDVIRQRYMTAKHASVEYGNLLIAKEFNYGSYVPRVVHHGELVFLEHSPDYCDRDPHLGSVGTHGRSCTMDPEKKGHSEHCNNMCCGRGARHYNETVMDNCNCRMTKQFKAATVFEAYEDIQEGQLVVLFLLHRKLYVREDRIQTFLECQQLIPADNDEGIIHIPGPELRTASAMNPEIGEHIGVLFTCSQIAPSSVKYILRQSFRN
nr:unnamed protein product [Spirometra erinaceieuropaei]